MNRPLMRGALVLVSAAAIGLFALHRTRVNRESREQLLEFRDAASKATTSLEIEKLFEAAGHERLTLVKWSAERWAVQTPLEWGATNWLLYMDFASGNLVALKVRSADSAEVRPDDAPPDIVRS